MTGFYPLKRKPQFVGLVVKWLNTHLHNNYDNEEKTNKKNIEIEGASVKSLYM